MFSLIETKKEISKAQRKLEATIFDAKVFTNGRYWYQSKDCGEGDLKQRRLNLFGLISNDADQQIVQINTPYEGRNDKIAGFFARDNETGAIYLMHSGQVGGGVLGVGKTAFLVWSNQRPIEVVDSSGGIKEGVLVMPIEGVAASRSAIWYIDKVAEFKRAVREGDLTSPEFKCKLKVFKAESHGWRKGLRSGEIDYLSRHGEVVDALYSWRLSSTLPENGRLVNNVLIDMGVVVGSELVEVFEVKTSAARYDIYTAIGQLMVHGTLNRCRRVIVLPQGENMAPDLTDTLQRLNIELLTFDLNEEAATIV